VKKLAHNLKFINKENIDLKYLNPFALKKLSNIVSRNRSSNISDNNKYKTVNINIENIRESNKINLDKKKILFLKKYNNNFVIRFLEKFFNRNHKHKGHLSIKDDEPSIIDEYETQVLHIDTYRCTLISGEPTLTEHIAKQWSDKNELDKLTFSPADKPTLEKIKRDYL
jgi:hypothetical protein